MEIDRLTIIGSLEQAQKNPSLGKFIRDSRSSFGGCYLLKEEPGDLLRARRVLTAQQIPTNNIQIHDSLKEKVAAILTDFANPTAFINIIEDRPVQFTNLLDELVKSDILDIDILQRFTVISFAANQEYDFRDPNTQIRLVSLPINLPAYTTHPTPAY